MYNPLSQKLAMITPETLIVGVDVAKHTYYAQMNNFRREELHKLFPFQKTISCIGVLVQQIKTTLLRKVVNKESDLAAAEASGHIHGPEIDEMVEMVEMVRPEILIPVHTENPGFFWRFEGICRVVYPEKGEAVKV
ncbi:hypothetical protein [Desulfofundulus thermosubterraneus]|uniref:RNA-metabolising metallo-beta-lactamase n=1 Tax=Desulfofundulus thermosubterraneus DSM 16057 TaxID=1121432 RepID=A0A1M6J8W6_9FIRM|nr:hypothetical protein [Desulfofundulus thermosubterraneus]SHJ43062.1 hypothetical protein SAMN02745219_02533 [Desulfofundulus thermosubterraneus DSM 16057]